MSSSRTLTRTPSRIIFSLFILSLTWCVSEQASWDLLLDFKYYTNEDGLLNGGDCCDGADQTGSCGGCDYRMLLCLDDSAVNMVCASAASLQRQFDLSPNRNNYDFTASYASGVMNPVSMVYSGSGSSVDLKVIVLDVDGGMETALVDILVNSLTLQVGTTSRVFATSDTQLTFDVTVGCTFGYYGDDCDVYCMPRDDCTGHYTCNDADGSKACDAGWDGTDCDVAAGECGDATNPLLSGEWEGEMNCGSEVVTFELQLFPAYSNAIDNYYGIMEFDLDGETWITTVSVEVDSFSGMSLLGGEMTTAPSFATGTELMSWDHGTYVIVDGGFVMESDSFIGTGFTCDSFHAEQKTAELACFNSGTCYLADNDDIFTATCCCPTDYNAPFCMTMSTSCSETCTANEYCESTNNTCVCLPGYTGASCDQSAGGLTCESEPSPCVNGGTCTDPEDSGYTCSCMPGYSGDQCEVAPSPCAGDFYGPTCETFCSPQDTCPTGHYSCNMTTGGRICNDGWTGEKCTVPMTTADHCPTGGCENGGSCYDGSCCCVNGYTGDFCELVDDCDSNPCLNGGTCTLTSNGYECSCPDGYSGERCEMMDGTTMAEEMTTMAEEMTTMAEEMTTTEETTTMELLEQLLELIGSISDGAVNEQTVADIIAEALAAGESTSRRKKRAVSDISVSVINSARSMQADG